MGNITSAFDVEKACTVKNDTFDASDCLPQFILDAANNVVGVSSFGGIEPGKFATDPDVAGIGVLLAFIIPSALALLIGAILSVRPVHDRLPERFQSPIIRKFAPTRPERLRVPYEGPPSFLRRKYREDTVESGQGILQDDNVQFGYPTNQNNFLAPSYPASQTYQLQDQYPAHHEDYSQPGNPHDDQFSSAPSDQVGDGDAKSTLGEKTPSSEMVYDMLQAALQNITDTQILLALALNISFFVVGKCQMSLYHFRLGLNIVEIACANSFLSLLLVRDYWKAPVSAVIRLFALGISLFMLFALLGLQRERGYSAERLPSPERKDSLILLKASCFLDKHLGDVIFANVTTNNTDQFSSTFINDQANGGIALTEKEYEAVGHLDYTKSTSEWNILIALTVNLILALVYAICRYFARYTRFRIRHVIFFSYSVGTWFFCLIVLSINASYMFDLRRWVNGSGWFGSETENYIGLGQWAALMAMGGILISFFDRWTPFDRK